MNMFREFSSEKYRELFYNCVGNIPELISTVDHVFSSPPLRLIDSHHILNKNKSIILLYDTTKPYIKRYRSELVVDSSIYSSKQNCFMIYNPKEYYCISHTKLPNFSLQEKYLRVTLEKLSCLSDMQRENYIKRFKNITNIYSCGLVKGYTSSAFYLDLLPKLYKLCGFDNLSLFVRTKMISFYTSSICRRYIPRLIEDTLSEPYGLPTMARNKILKHPLFKPIRKDAAALFAEDTPLTFHQATSLIKEGLLAPSREILAWSLALANIKHFGKDYGFFSYLWNYLRNHGINSNFKALQETSHQGDGVDFIQFGSVRSYSLQNMLGKYSLMRANTKLSRVTNIVSIYLHLGEKIYEFWGEYLKSGQVKCINMGEII